MKSIFGGLALILIGFALDNFFPLDSYMSEGIRVYLAVMFPLVFLIYAWQRENRKIEAKIDSIEKTIDEIYSDIEDIRRKDD